jgi:hypothetical protein
MLRGWFHHKPKKGKDFLFRGASVHDVLLPFFPGPGVSGLSQIDEFHLLRPGFAHLGCGISYAGGPKDL